MARACALVKGPSVAGVSMVMSMGCSASSSKVSCTSGHTRPRRGLLANLPDSCCCKKTQHTTNTLPTSCQKRSHMLSTCLQDLIHTLNLPTGLRVIRGTEDNCRTNCLLKSLPELGGEQTAP